jgi:hypothetical protein
VLGQLGRASLVYPGLGRGADGAQVSISLTSRAVNQKKLAVSAQILMLGLSPIYLSGLLRREDWGASVISSWITRRYVIGGAEVASGGGAMVVRGAGLWRRQGGTASMAQRVPRRGASIPQNGLRDSGQMPSTVGRSWAFIPLLMENRRRHTPHSFSASHESTTVLVPLRQLQYVVRTYCTWYISPWCQVSFWLWRLAGPYLLAATRIRGRFWGFRGAFARSHCGEGDSGATIWCGEGNEK